MPKKTTKKSTAKNKKATEAAASLASPPPEAQAPPPMHEEIVDAQNYLIMTAAPEITSQVIYDSCNEILKEVKRKSKGLDVKLKKITQPINASLKAIRDLFKSPADQLTHLEHIIKTRMGNWLDEQERKRAEAIRIEDERIDKENRERLAAEQKAKDEAQKLADQGKTDEAKEESLKAFLTAQMTPVVPRAVAPPSVSTGAGTHRVMTYQVFITDKHAAVQSLLAANMMDCIEIKMGALNKMAAIKEGELRMDGFRVESKQSIRTRV